MEKSFTCRQVTLGGGGYITGLLQAPDAPQIMYARCDVAGIYKSSDKGCSWKTINKGMRYSSDHSVHSFAAGKTGLLLRASGEPKNQIMCGQIYRSTDYGENWELVLKDKLHFGGNCPTRMFGELLAVSPTNDNYIAATGYSGNIFFSEDRGISWQEAVIPTLPSGVLRFHPTKPGVIFYGTLQYYRHYNYIGLPPKGYPGYLYISEDNGKTWCLQSQNDMEFNNLAFSHDDEDLIIAATNKGIWRSEDNGKTFMPSSGLPDDLGCYKMPEDKNFPHNEPLRYTCICESRGESGIYYTAPDRRDHHDNTHVFPLYVSKDYGITWKMVSQDYVFRELPAYVNKAIIQGWAISDILSDYAKPHRFLLSNWFGVITSEDNGLSWNGHNYRGIENVCGQSITSGSDGAVYANFADHKPAKSTDNGETFTIISNPKGQLKGNGTCALVLRNSPSTILYGLFERGATSASVVRQKNGKDTVVMKLRPGQFPHDLKEGSNGAVYLFVTGIVPQNAGVFVSYDQGITFSKTDTQPGHFSAFPVNQQWIERELLPVVSVQPLNVCGANHHLETAPDRESLLYFAEWTEGLYISKNCGKVWSKTGRGLPFKKNRNSTLLSIKAMNNGILFAGFLSDGIYKSSNYGETFSKVFPQEGSFNGSTFTSFDNIIYAASEPLFFSEAESAIIRSEDYGQTWEKIIGTEYGALRWKGIHAISKNTLCGVTCGNGMYKIER